MRIALGIRWNYENIVKRLALVKYIVEFRRHCLFGVYFVLDFPFFHIPQRMISWEIYKKNSKHITYSQYEDVLESESSDSDVELEDSELS